MEQLRTPGSLQHEVAMRMPPSLAGHFGVRVVGCSGGPSLAKSPLAAGISPA